MLLEVPDDKRETAKKIRHENDRFFQNSLFLRRSSFNLNGKKIGNIRLNALKIRLSSVYTRGESTGHENVRVFLILDIYTSTKSRNLIFQQLHT